MDTIPTPAIERNAQDKLGRGHSTLTIQSVEIGLCRPLDRPVRATGTRIDIHHRRIDPRVGIPSTVEVVGHDVDPVGHLGNRLRIKVRDISITTRARDGKIVLLTIDCRLTIHLIPDRLQEEVVVGAIAGRRHSATIQSSAAWVFPIDVDAVKPVLHDDIDRRFGEIRPLLGISRNRVERGRQGPSTDRNHRLQFWILLF